MKSGFPLIITILASTASAADWEATAQRHVAMPGGKQYELSSAMPLHKTLRGAMPQCKRPNSSPFKLYLKIGASGSVLESATIPSSAEANCFATEFGKATWPKPPFAPFVMELKFFEK